MKSDTYLRAFADFLLDGAKIIFGSVVVGAFVPSAGGPTSWPTLLVGAVITFLFVVLSATITNLTLSERL